MSPNNEYTNYCYLFVCFLTSQLSEVVETAKSNRSIYNLSHYLILNLLAITKNVKKEKISEINLIIYFIITKILFHAINI